MSALPHVTEMQVLLDVVGVFAFGVSGGLAAVRGRLDLFGVVTLACVTALGGGVIRDVCIGALPPAGLSEIHLLASAVLAGLLTFWWSPAFTRTASLIMVMDAFGLALFCVSGSLKAIEFAAGPIAAVLVGLVTAVGGGMIRDVLVGTVPEVLRRDLYALPAALGSVMLVAGRMNGLWAWWFPVICALVVLVLRLTAVRLAVNAPLPRQGGSTP